MDIESVLSPVRPKRTFISEEFKITSWSDLKPYFDDLADRKIDSTEDMRKWLRDRSELESAISEDLGWRYIHMTCYTENEAYNKSYEDFIVSIQPHLSVVADVLNKKATASVHLNELEHEPGFNIMIRNVRKEIELFREENIPLFTEINTKTQKYGQLFGAMTVEHEGNELTLQQASVILMSTDREKREEIYYKINDRRLKDKTELDQLFSELIQLRHNVALHAGFENFRDYMFKSLGRFDYTPNDCFNFHDSIHHEVVPILNTLAKDRKEKLKVDSLRPWDKSVDPLGRDALKAFSSAEDLIQKSIGVFEKVDPFLGECLTVMKQIGHLDLDSRKGKAPGGYNYPLAETGIPFIFMNATSTLNDVGTIMHEGGHAIHNFLTRNLELADFKSTPSELAELASMSMELLSMDNWDIFFPNHNDLVRAKREHLEDIIETLPWVATIDKYQHWIYENPLHTSAERTTHWVTIFDQFSDGITDWSNLQEAKEYLWQKQLHLYEVPFYYIEYGMAQLGAIAIWRNYKLNKQKGLQGYMNALKLGYTQSIPEVYKAAGIEFNFKREYIKELIQFVKAEIDKLS